MSTTLHKKKLHWNLNFGISLMENLLYWNSAYLIVSFLQIINDNQY